jgi:PKHD-type hydroxylase
MFDIAPEIFDRRFCECVIKELKDETTDASLILDERTGEISRDGKIRRSRSRFVTPTHWVAKELIRLASCSAVFPLNDLICQCVQFSVYAENDKYDWHTDNYPAPLSKDCPRSWIGLNRRISISANITDPEQYDGGDLQFLIGSTVVPNASGRHRLRGQGTVIVFPSMAMHRVSPVTRGVRYSLVSWFLG